MDYEQLIRRASGGDVKAFVDLTRQFQHMAFGAALALVNDFHQAEDVVQEAFVAAWSALPSLADPAAFPGWLRGIVRHQAFRVLRKKTLRTVPLDRPIAFYYFCFVLVGLAVAFLKRILDSPFGAVLQAIRENSDRAVACGYDVNRVKHLSFVFSALFAGLAGSLDALRLTVVPIESLYWTTSGQVVMMTLLGGAGTFFGPFVGALTYLVLEDRLAAFTESWPLVIGAIFSAFVLFLPKGIWGTLTGGIHGRQSA